MIYAYDAIEDGMHAVMFPVALHFGFVRWACENGVLDWHSEIRIAVSHDTKEYGETAYALMNAITDLATRPPVRVCGYCFVAGERHRPEHEERYDAWGRPYCFIRRERHSLQRLAGIWLAEFSRSVLRPGFDLDAYLKAPSRDRLQGASERTNGRSRRSRRAERR